jgi:serine/threonine-protein kinase
MVEGSQIGAYRVLHRIGEGGMGSVWLAEHSMLGRRAAIKVLHPEFSSRPEIVTRFFNEARAATAIPDPGIVQIFDFGNHTDGSAYIVMELLDGEPLDKRLERLGALAVPDALRIMRQVASTLGAAHGRGIVHRDLKPENIFVVRDPEVASGERAKVLDFGIAKLSGDKAGVKTQTSAMMGTPTYMSPEQCRGAGHVDQRSDVYALGCVLFALLCGRPPFQGEGIGDLIVMHLQEAPPTPSSVRPGLPPEIDQIILRCLQKDPTQRFASGGELAIALGALLGSSPQVAAPPVAYAAHTTPTTLSTAAGTVSMAPAPKRPLLFVVAGLGAAAAGVTAFVLLRGRGASADKPAEADKTAAPPEERATTGSTVAVAAAPPTPSPPTTPPPPAAPDPSSETAARMRPVVERFVGWAHDHAGAPCPDLAGLGVAATDPWGHAFKITCTDQPSDQIIGAISAGPDGAFGTDDDIASWQLGHDVTELVRGARWAVAAPAKDVAAAPRKKHSTTHAATAAKPTTPKPERPAGGLELDANGLPISR